MSAPSVQLSYLPFNVDSKLGAPFIGGLISYSLWGITCIQTFIYFYGRPNDLPIVKLLIAFLWCWDTFDTAITGHAMYYYFVTNYANPAALLQSVWSYKIRTLSTSLPLFIIRGLFLRRVYRLSEGNKVLTTGLFTFNVLTLVTAIIVTVKLFGLNSYLAIHTLDNYIYLMFAGGLTAEAGIAIALCYYLQQARTGFESTDGLINILIIYIIQTGMTTFVFGLLSLICYVTMMDNLVYLAFYLVLSKLYLNSYLASLNARHSLRKRNKQTLSFNLSQIAQSQQSSEVRERPCRPTIVQVEKTAFSVSTGSSDHRFLMPQL